MKIKNLDKTVLTRIDKIVSSNFNIILGDADGVDTAVQKYLHECNFGNVTIYSSSSQPRNNIGRWPLKLVQNEFTPGTRAFFTAKDIQLAKDAEFGLMIWDSKSTGTLSNVIELLIQKKSSVIYVNKIKEFINVKTVIDLECLLKNMSDDSMKKAEEKIKINSKINSLKFQQTTMFEEN